MVSYNGSLYDRAIRAKTTKEMEDVRRYANNLIGKHAPVEQEEYLVYGYADGWLEATRRLQRERHHHMMDYHPDYKEMWEERMREVRDR